MEQLIEYALTDSDRKSLSASFGVEVSSIPTRVTGGVVNDRLSGVTFVETIGGHRIALRFEGRPALSGASARMLVNRHQNAA